MKMNLKKSIVALVPVLAIGAVGAQMLSIEAPGSENVVQPSEAPIVMVDTTTTQVLTGTDPVVVAEPVTVSESVAVSEPTVVAQANPPVITERGTIRQESYRTAVPGYALPRSVSPRSGENSGEEIATRTAPVDIRAGLSADFLTDQSPGV